MLNKNVSEMIAIIRAGAGMTLDIQEMSIDDVIPIITEAGNRQVPVRIRGAETWSLKYCVQVATAGKGMVSFE